MGIVRITGPLSACFNPRLSIEPTTRREERRVERVDQARGKKSLCDRKVHDGNSKEIAGQDADGRADAQSDLDARLAEVERVLAEAALAHALPDTEGSYWRGNRAIDRRREVMERYANWLNGESAQVIEFAASKKA